MDPNPSPSLLQPPSRTLRSFSDAENDSFTGKNDTQNGVDASSNAARGSIAERRAAKFGFKAERISTPRFRTTSPLTSPAASGIQSPFITIPPGISPTALLDSPMMLPNSQPSPTTGTFPLPHLSYGGSTKLNAGIPADGDMDNNSDTFRFKPQTDSFVGFDTVDNQGHRNSADFQTIDFEFRVDFSKEARTENYGGDSTTDLKVVNSTNENANHSDMQIGHIDVADNQISQQIEPVHGENISSQHPRNEDKGTFSAAGIGRNSEDGYNWRKYGQKQVKGSEYPRSYYKCTNPNCEVKKKIERSCDGQVTEIIYKGTHNHLKPQPSRRTLVGSASSYDEIPEMDENSDRCVKGEAGSVWNIFQPGNVRHGYEWKLDGPERTSSTSVLTELSDPLSTTQGKSMGTFDSADLSSTLISNNDDDDDDEATQGSISLGAYASAEESESKRRKIESCLVETSLTSRAVREPRVVVQIESEIDILDDGYRWRKYGQKVVKGNPNPRSYYKCTSAGCIVRKHVERASHNLKFVITTYEGKHNHEVPAARNSCNVNSSNNSLTHVSNKSQPVLTLARNANGPKPEKPIQNYASEYSRPVFAGNFSNDMKLGNPSNYPLRFPAFQRTVPYGSFESNHCAIQQSGSIASLVPDFALSMPPSLHASANLSLAGADFNYDAKPIGQDRPFISGQQLIRPKQEKRNDNIYDAGQSIMDHVNASPSSSSLYHHMMGNFPS